MEDEHIRIDDLSSHFGYLFSYPVPSAFYEVFDGHGGPESDAYTRKNAMRFFFEDDEFPQTVEADEGFLKEVENVAFLLADLALADDCVVTSYGTTTLTALVLGRTLLVAKAGDCILCGKGQAIEMSQDHKPIYTQEHIRVEELGEYVDEGYLNGVLSVTHALGDWVMKFPRDTPSPLIAEAEFKWCTFSDPEQCARELVIEALRASLREQSSPRQRRLRCCSLSVEAISSLKSMLNGSN